MLKVYSLVFTFLFSIFAFADEVKLCLTMMVKNDAAVIGSCLQSARGLIDCLSICDVGSTDDTLFLVKQFMEETGIPGRIYKHEWKNFGHNRTLAARAAQKTLKELHFPLVQSYLLVLDPETRLIAQPEFKKASLDADAYLILEKSSTFGYSHYGIHLLRALLPWESNGITHDVWSLHGQDRCLKLRSLLIEECQTPEGKEIKIKNEIEVLKKALKETPDNLHYLFYLAQSHRCLKNYEEAISLYRSQVEKERDKEKIWFSKYMIGECYEEMNEWDRALYWFLEAFQEDPNRTESLRKIATYYRLHGQNDLAYLFAKHGSRIPFWNDSFLLPSQPLYDYQFEEEVSIAAYYTRFREDGYAAANGLILRKKVPWYIKNQTYRNIEFYVKNLKDAQFQKIEFNLPLIGQESGQQYNPMNPSIYKTEDGYKVICRTVNYTQVGAKIFNTVDPDGIFRTRNFFLHYDTQFNLLSQQEIIEDLPRERIRSFSLEGLDDCRAFAFNHSSWFTCTTSDTSSTGNFQISLCKLADGSFGNTIDVEKLIPLKGPDPYRCEKNWLPFVKDGSIHLIYSCHPFTVYKPNIETGDCEKFLHYEPAHDLGQFRGSAAPIEIDDGYLMLVHEVIHLPDYSRYYLHRFVCLDKEFSVTQVSKPFTFLHLGIEFSCGMTLDHSGTKLIIPIGVEDREAYLCSMDLKAVRSLLEPLPDIEKFP